MTVISWEKNKSSKRVQIEASSKESGEASKGFLPLEIKLGQEN